VIERYLQRLGAFLAPASVEAAENALRQLACWIITDAGLDSIAAVRRDDIEDYKVWLAAQLPAGGGTITAETHRQRARPRARRAAYTRRQAGLECTCGPWRSFIDSEPGPREVPAD
jgi:hypothetical protein